MPDNQLLVPEKIPPGWLDQIREVVKSEKPQLWLVLLTSSVLAAFIGAASSYWAVRSTTAANKELETIKTRLELEKETLRSRVAAYNKLSQNLNTFAERLEGFANFVQISGRDRPTPKRTAHIQQELRAVGISEHDMNDARNDPVLNGTHAQQIVDECLRQLNPALAKARKDPSASLSSIRSAVAQLRNIIPEIQRDVSNEISSIR
ncbi:MAG: hypothetical protein LAO23_18005 [Acidobacteriia bacterium]|nr:hypothetical protein [Terriglobia bacterium]